MLRRKPLHCAFDCLIDAGGAVGPFTGQKTNALPRALEAQIVLAGGERISRVFPLR